MRGGARFKHHLGGRVAICSQGRSKQPPIACAARPRAWWERDVTQARAGALVAAAVAVWRPASIGRALAACIAVASLSGCILTQDLPDPALDVPQGYKAA